MNLKTQRVEGEEGRGSWKVPDVHPYNLSLFLMSGCHAHYSCFPISLYLFKADEENRSFSGAVDQILREHDLKAAPEHT